MWWVGSRLWPICPSGYSAHIQSFTTGQPLYFGSFFRYLGQIVHGADGPTGNLLGMGANHRNALTAVAIGDQGGFSLNGQALTDPGGDGFIVLGTDTCTGRTYIINGLYAGTERSGAITHYENFTVEEFFIYGAADSADFRALASELAREQQALLASTESVERGAHQPEE